MAAWQNVRTAGAYRFTADIQQELIPLATAGSRMADAIVEMSSKGFGCVGVVDRDSRLVGIITDGYCRDTAEIVLQKTPVCARKRGRPIIPGRIELVEVQTTIACGGAQVRPGDIVGCDDDGIVVVPIEVAEEVAIHARAVLLADMRGRRKLYERLGMTPDATVDFETVEAYYNQLQI